LNKGSRNKTWPTCWTFFSTRQQLLPEAKVNVLRRRQRQPAMAMAKFWTFTSVADSPRTITSSSFSRYGHNSTGSDSLATPASRLRGDPKSLPGSAALWLPSSRLFLRMTSTIWAAQLGPWQPQPLAPTRDAFLRPSWSAGSLSFSTASRSVYRWTRASAHDSERLPGNRPARRGVLLWSNGNRADRRGRRHGVAL